MAILHAVKNWPAAAFWRYPNNILGGVFYIAGFTVNAILGVNLQNFFILFLHDFVYTCWAIALFWRIIFG